LNETLLGKAVAAKVLRTSKIRVDTTVIPADVARAINRIATTGRRIRASGGLREPDCGTGPGPLGGGHMI
jgi:IS5 family transposase